MTDNQLPSLKWVFSGGGELTLKMEELVAQKLPATNLCNLYGPTESLIDTSFYPYKPTPVYSVPPIGRPISNTSLYVLDSMLNPTGISITGELYIAGAGLARGYQNRPELTAEKFIANPFSKIPGARMYKTGDLCRYLPDGNIEFIGRIDHQVKIRGFRIELGEIEASLLKHPNIREAVVLAREDSPGEKRLVSYCVARSPEIETQADDLRYFLKETLPEYMIPVAFVFLEKIPLTPNGKLDRKALLPPEYKSKEVYTPPRNPTEEILCGLFEKILRINSVGVFDNFFELGGSSLLVTPLIYQIRATFNTSVSFVTFFKSPTVASLASIINPLENLTISSDTKPWIEDYQLANKLPKVTVSKAFAASPKAILLTGASGFIGSHLLRSLLSETRAQIYCLIKDDTQAQVNFKKSLDRFGLSLLADDRRVHILHGDLAKPKLGLSQTDYDFIEDNIDSIYHCGAIVNHIYDYGLLRHCNVLSTLELLKLCYKKPKKFVFISTTSSNFDPIIKEAFPENSPTGVEEGYQISKWTSEKILATALRKGYPITIYRFGQAMGDSKTGIGPTDNIHIWMILKGSIQTGGIPKELSQINITPVDFLTKAIVKTALLPSSTGAVYNLVHPHSLHISRLLTWMSDIGYTLTRIPYQQWQKIITDDNTRTALYPLSGLHQSTNTEEPEKINKEIEIISTKTQKALRKVGLVYPEISESLIKSYFEQAKKWLRE
jgi:thioester reductase-like protein